MKKITLFIYILIITLSISSVDAYNDNYYAESISKFINSPDFSDLEKIEDNRIKNCEKVYLEATRRRDYTEAEKLVCSDIFRIKMQEELDYITYSLRNRGIYY